MTSLSVLVPVYNEQYLVAESLKRLEALASSSLLTRIQVVVVDDASRDGTATALAEFASARGMALVDASSSLEKPERETGDAIERGCGRQGKIEWLFLRHARNGGKGAAIRTGIARADCAVTVIHDADLEYHPEDILKMMRVFVEDGADAVFGSRFAGGSARRVLLFRHEVGNRLLTLLTNLVTNLNLTDMETCYKAVRTDLLKSIPIVSRDFRLEPELTIKLAKREARIFEVSIRYSGRTYQEGKKIGWRDGFKALGAILRFAVSDDIYVADEAGSQILARLSRAPRFNEWMAEVIRPYLGASVLEIGAGTGNLTRKLVPRDAYVASDVNPLYLKTLENLMVDRPYLSARYVDVNDDGTFPEANGGYDSVVCLNVIEHVDDDVAALGNLGAALSERGCAVVLVPHGQWNLGTLDEVLGHRRRYSEESLRSAAAKAGLSVRKIIPFNRASSIPWWFNGKVLRRREFGLFQIKMVNLLTPLLRKIDKWLPLPPLSLIAIIERASAPSEAPLKVGVVATTPPLGGDPGPFAPGK